MNRITVVNFRNKLFRRMKEVGNVRKGARGRKPKAMSEEVFNLTKQFVSIYGELVVSHGDSKVYLHFFSFFKDVSPQTHTHFKKK